MGIKASDIKCTICGKQFRTVKKTEQRYEDYHPYTEEVYYPAPDEDIVEVRGVSGYVCVGCFSKGGEHIREILKGHIGRHKYCVEKELENIDEKYRKIIEQEKYLLNKELRGLKEINDLIEMEEKVDRLKYKELKEKSKQDLRMSSYLKDISHILEWEDSYYYGKKRIKEYNKDYGLDVKRYPYDIWEWDMVTKEEYFDIILNSTVENKTPMEILFLMHKDKEVK